MNGYSPFNLIMLIIFLDVPNVLAFEFTPFGTFLLQCQLRNVFETSTKFNVIGLKGLYSFIF